MLIGIQCIILECVVKVLKFIIIKVPLTLCRPSLSRKYCIGQVLASLLCFLSSLSLVSVCILLYYIVFLTQAVNMTELQVKNTIAQFVETNVGIPADV